MSYIQSIRQHCKVFFKETLSRRRRWLVNGTGRKKGRELVLELTSVEFLSGPAFVRATTTTATSYGEKKVINFFFIMSNGCTPVIIIISKSGRLRSIGGVARLQGGWRGWSRWQRSSLGQSL